MNLISPKYFPLILLTAGLTSCLDSPVVPSWTVKGTTSLLDSKLSALELVKATDSSVINESTQLFFVKTITLKDINLGDSIKVESKGFNGEQVMDSLKIDAFDSDPLTIKANALNPLLVNNFTGPVIPFNFSVSNRDFTGLTEYEYADIEPESPGHLQLVSLKIANNLPIPITIKTVTLKNKATGLVIGTQTINKTISAGSFSSVDLAMGGTRITNTMQLSFDGSSTGATSAKIEPSSGIDFTISSDELLVSEAKGKIAGFSYVSTQTVDAGMEDFSPTLIEVKSGNLNYTVVNNSEMTGFATIKIPELKKNGVVYQGQITIPPKSTAKNTPSLAGYTIIPAYPAINSPKLNLIVTFDLQKSSGLIKVKKTDNITYTASIDSIKHKFAKGKIKERIQDSDPDTSEIKWPDDLKDVNLQFDKATMTSYLTSSLGIPAEVTPHVLFDQEDGQTDNLTFAPGVFPMTLSAAELPNDPFIRLTKAVELNQIPDFNSILDKKPKQVRYYVSAIAARGGLVDGFVFDTSAVRGSIELKVPLRLKSTTGYEKDSLYEVSPGKLTGMKSASLILDVKNRVPLKLGLTFAFIDSTKKTLVSFPKPATGKAYYSLPVPPIGSDGRSTGYKTEKIIITLEESDFKQLETASFIQLKYRVDTNESQGPSGGYSEILTTDDIHIVLGADIQYKVNEE
ncbi:MAG: hypothetical protein J0L62_06800 [Bacteroidetes bacterium]|nr:hypothetical protein [Bacteroidota bacterium]